MTEVNGRVRPIFIVGSSRSGTTMLAKMLGRHSRVVEVVETHYFEENVPPGAVKGGRAVPRDRAIDLVAGLIASNRLGYFRRDESAPFREEAAAAVDATDLPLNYSSVFLMFLEIEARRAGAHYVVEQTPRNVYYLGELTAAYPEAKFISTIRDPRDVLISQKNRWKRRFLGAKQMPMLDVLRTWVNYHPWLISRIWYSSVAAALPWSETGRLKLLRYEDMLARPRESMEALTAFLEVEFEEAMLDAPQTGSSRQPDSQASWGVDPSRAQRWKQGGLNPGELALCTSVNRSLMKDLGYDTQAATLWHPLTLLYWLTLPVNAGLALVLNASRFSDVFGAVRRRFGSPSW